MNLSYFCTHIMKSIHAPIRIYGLPKIYDLKSYYGDEGYSDPILIDVLFRNKLLGLATQEFPVIYMEKYPIVYSVIQDKEDIYILGPVSVEYENKWKFEKYIIKNHGLNENFRISYCNYNRFCEEILMLFYLLSGQALSYHQLNEKNYMTQKLLRNIGENINQLFFCYQEETKIHNPYSREVREMNSIREGDVGNLLKILDEPFVGEYAILSKIPLRAMKNLAIVGLAISARAAIEGGINYEEAFSLNDSYILQVDEAVNMGEIESLVRKAKIEYTEQVCFFKNDRPKNKLIEECKTIIFRKLHSKIIIGELAQELNVSLEYLSFLFKKTEGLCINQYIMNEKIKASKKLIIYSTLSIEQIALYLGFSSQSHFGKVFRKFEGHSPGSYKKMYRITES